MNFKQLVTTLLDYSDKSPLAVAHQAKRAINDAISWMNRRQAFKFLEGIAEVSYPPDVNYVDLQLLCAKDIHDIISVQGLNKSGDYEGKVLPIIDYSRIQARRFRQDGVLQRDHPTSFDVTFVSEGSQFGYMVYLLDRGIGLYPRPTSSVPLLIHFNEKLRPLVEDEDENLLTQNCADFIVTKALFSKFSLYLDPERVKGFSPEVLATEWDAVVEWDRRVRNSEFYFSSL